MSFPGIGLRPFSAEMWLIATIVAVLLAPFFSRRSNAVCALVSLVGLICAFVSTIVVGVPLMSTRRLITFGSA